MYSFAVQIAAPVVGDDESHRDCACVGLVVALPDGKLQLYAETAAELEALGWGILGAVEQMKKTVPAPPEEHTHA
jgi:hypothetical protein